MGVFALFILLFSYQSSFAHWSTKGPYGGRVSSFTIIDSTVYLGSPTGGVYASTTNLFTAWSYKNYTGLFSGRTAALTHIGKRLIDATADSGIYISTNLGVNWSTSNSGLSNRNTLSLVSSNGNVFAGTDGGGVFMSSDSGNTWMSMNSGLTNLHVTALAAAGDTIFAGTAGGGVFASLNAGSTWIALNTGLTDLNIKSLALSLSHGSLFAGTPSGVFQGSTLTFSWTLSNTGLTNTQVNTLLINGDSLLYAGTNAGVFYSPLSSVSWTSAGSGADTVNALTAFRTKIFAGTPNKGVEIATIGTYSWTITNTGFNNLETYALASRDSTVLVSNEQGVFVCKNYILSAVYSVSNTGLADSLHVNALGINASHVLYAGTANNGVYVSADSGAHWTTANTGLTNLSVSKLLVTATKIYLVTTNGNVFSTLQSNLSWSQNSTGLPSNLVITAVVNAGDSIYIGSPSGVYTSISGSSWTSAGFTQNVTSLAVVGGNIFAGTATNGVYKSSLYSQTWTAVAPLPSQAITALGSSEGYILAAYDGGGQASCNGGQTWHPFNVYLYNPNYSRVSAFTTIVPRVYALNPHHGPLSNAKTEYPVVVPDTIAQISAPSICAGSTVTLSVPSDVEASSYTWTLPGTWTGTSTTSSITATVDNTSGTVTVQSANGCGVAPVKTATITVNAAPTGVMAMVSQSTICNNAAPLALNAGMPAGGVYTGTGVSGGSFYPATAGAGSYVITYTYTNASGCSSADSATITVNICTGINSIDGSAVAVFPNPFTNEITVTTEGIGNSAMLTLSDVTGKIINTIPVNASSNRTIVNTSALESGIYLLSLTDGGKITATQKVVKAE